MRFMLLTAPRREEVVEALGALASVLETIESSLGAGSGWANAVRHSPHPCCTLAMRRAAG
jgi:hypothetical protein